MSILRFSFLLFLFLTSHLKCFTSQLNWTVSLQHHMQMHHTNKGSEREPPPQIHIPHKDGHKRYHQQHYHDMPPQSYPQHHPSNQHYGDANGGVKSSVKSRALTGGSTSRKQSYKGIVQQNRRDPDMQFVDPPQEFLFNATKESRYTT